MANSDFVTSSKQKIRIGEVNANTPNSSAINRKLSGTMNALIDSSFYQLDVYHNGYFSAAADYFTYAPYRIEAASTIAYYSFSLDSSGSSGDTTFNVAIYDDTGTFVNNLFGATTDRLLISGSSGSRVVIGRDITNSETFDTNAGGHTIQYGGVNLTSLSAGYILVPFVEEFATNARSFRFNMRIREV